MPGKVSLVAGLVGSSSPQAGPLAGALSETVNPNVLASALLLVAPLCLALALGPRWTALPGVRVLWGVAALLVYAELILTQSRGAWFAAARGRAAVAGSALAALRWLALAALVAGIALLPLAGLALLLDTVISGPGGTDMDWAHAWRSGSGPPGRCTISRLRASAWGCSSSVIPVRYPYPSPSMGAGASRTHTTCCCRWASTSACRVSCSTWPCCWSSPPCWSASCAGGLERASGSA